MNKAQLIESLADRLGGKKAATEAVDAVLETIQRTVKDGIPVAISGFGVFEKVTVPARRHRNPRTGEPVRTKKTTRPKFRPGQRFKDVVNGTRKLPKLTAAASATATKATVSATRSVASGSRSATKAAPATGSSSAGQRKTPVRGTSKPAAGTASTAKSAAKAPAKTAKATKTTATKSARLTKSTSTATKSAPAKRTAKRTANA